MKPAMKAVLWSLTLPFLAWSAPSPNASELTLGSPPGINVFKVANYLISGATVAAVPAQQAAFEAYSLGDANHDGIFNSGDGLRRAIGTYDNGLFGLFSLCQSFGGFRAAGQSVRTRGILVIDDMVISTSEPSPPATIPVSVNFHVSGQLSHFQHVAEPEFLEGALEMAVTINGSVFPGEYSWRDGSGGSSSEVTGLGTQIAGGGFADPFSATITTGTANVPVNTPFTLRVEFVGVAGCGGASNNAYGGITFDARNTAGFLPGAPIFNNLPPGYTAGSDELNIVNNAFQSAPVPVEAVTWGDIKRRFSPK